MSTRRSVKPAANPDEIVCELEEIREGIGLSRDQLAQLVDTSRVQIYRLEKGQQEPGLMLALRLSRVLGLPVDQLWHVRSYEKIEAFRGELPANLPRRNKRRKVVSPD